MARARNIKPSFFTCDKLAEVPPLGRLLFAGLWCLADRAGKLEDRPKRIKVELLPYDNCDVDKLLNVLQQGGFIQRYSVNGSRYIQVINFERHQNPHVKEAESTIPAPCEHGASTVQAPEIPERAGLIPDSGFLIPETNTAGLPPAPAPDLPGFDHFWRTYPNTPRRVAKSKCRDLWVRRGLEANASAIVAHVATMKLSKAWQPDSGGSSFEPAPLTYLNQRRWEDGTPLVEVAARRVAL